jgi:hypothetical protein
LTLVHLYTLYRHIYRDYDQVFERSPAIAAALPPVARAVAEFAESDARDGKPLRSFPEFERELAYGADALRPLGWSAA